MRFAYVCCLGSILTVVGCGSSSSSSGTGGDGGAPGTTSPTTGASTDLSSTSSGLSTSSSTGGSSLTGVSCDVQADCADVFYLGDRPTRCIHHDGMCGDGERGTCDPCTCGGEGCIQFDPVCSCAGAVVTAPSQCSSFEYSRDVTRCSGGATFACGDTTCERLTEVCTRAADGSEACQATPTDLCTFGVATCACLGLQSNFARCTDDPGTKVACSCPLGDVVCGDGGACGPGDTCLASAGSACTACGAAGVCNGAQVCDPSGSACGGGDFCWEDACTHVVAIGAGDDACALLSTGAIQCWGAPAPVETALTPVPILHSGATSLSVGSDMKTCAVTATGTVVCRRGNEPGSAFFGYVFDGPVPVPGLSNIASTAAGLWHACALRADGDVFCWGENTYGELGDGTTNASPVVPVQVVGLPSPAIAIAAGSFSTCAITELDGLWCWGNNEEGALGDGSTVDSSVPVAVLGLGPDVAQVSMRFTTCAVTADGELFCWGYGPSGQVGNGSGASSPVPVSVMVDVASVSVGGHVCAMTISGEVRCWGPNTDGQLGDGTTNDAFVPIPVVGVGANVVQVSAGNHSTCALDDTGNVLCWGRLGGVTPTPVVQP